MFSSRRPFVSCNVRLVRGLTLFRKVGGSCEYQVNFEVNSHARGAQRTFASLNASNRERPPLNPLTPPPDLQQTSKQIFEQTPSMELTDDERESRLLTLPPELRNIIYRHTLVDGTFKIYGSGPSTQPSLLQVNHQIRHEAIQLYYSENFFAWHIRAFDRTQYLTWC